VAEEPDGVVERLQPPKISSRLAIRQRVTTRFSILPPFPLPGPIEGFVVSIERYFDGLNDRLKSGWVNDVRIRYSNLGAQVNREFGSDSVCRWHNHYDSRQRTRSWRRNPREVLRLCRAPAKSAGKAKARATPLRMTTATVAYLLPRLTCAGRSACATGRVPVPR
jgi:hypothetical protein